MIPACSEHQGIEAAIDACDGDAHAALRALIIANRFLEAELERAVSRLSAGFVRGKLRVTKTGDVGADHREAKN